ncbi:MAG: hypothetical protein QF609_05895 [Gammaproteobacteria bacterium]|nr:hypothetical protein [Gammaproteobacteria bacterium]
MNPSRFFRLDAADDALHGQKALVAARWILILGGLVLSIWAPGEIDVLRIQLLFILGLAVMNFYLHAQLLRRGPVVETVAYAASIGDIAVISGIIIAQGVVDSSTFNFYFPALMAISVAFPTAISFMFAGSALAIYSLVALVSAPGVTPYGESTTVFLTRLVMLAAVVACGNLYWRIERRRRREADEA